MNTTRGQLEKITILTHNSKLQFKINQDNESVNFFCNILLRLMKWSEIDYELNLQ